MAHDEALPVVSRIAAVDHCHEQVEQAFNQAIRSTATLEDGLAIAISQVHEGSQELRHLIALQDKVVEVQDPVSRLLSELEILRDALQPIRKIALTVSQQQKVQEDRERVLESANEVLENSRSKLQEDLEAFERLRRDHEQETLELKLSTDPDSEAEQLRDILRDVRAQLRDAQDAAASRDRLMDKRGIQLADARIELEQLQAENAKLQDELRNSNRKQKRAVEQAKETVARLQHELQASQHREVKAQQLLAAETKKQRVLQMTLQRELSDRDRTNGKADNKSASNAELPALDAHRRAISAPGTTMLRPGTGNVDVIKTLQRNQALINEVTDRRFENDKLRQDNAALLLHAKDASLDSLSLRNHVATSLADREELIRRLRKADSDAKRWKDQLNSIARKASRQRFEEKYASRCLHRSILFAFQTCGSKDACCAAGVSGACKIIPFNVPIYGQLQFKCPASAHVEYEVSNLLFRKRESPRHPQGSVATTM
eukprot:m.561995 g.561995  ORF g.561995 m.561995 type:complete len:489 (-) comp22219_c0_seq1:409-1875(-)